jgi:hypothetical protein
LSLANERPGAIGRSRGVILGVSQTRFAVQRL